MFHKKLQRSTSAFSVFIFILFILVGTLLLRPHIAYADIAKYTWNGSTKINVTIDQSANGGSLFTFNNFTGSVDANGNGTFSADLPGSCGTETLKVSFNTSDNKYHAVGNPVDFCGYQFVDAAFAGGTGAPAPPANGGAGGGSTTEQPSCETTGFSMSWILCKIIDGLADTVDGIYSGLIEPMLKTPNVSPTSVSGNKIFAAWSTFRTYGDVFLVIALLVVVFGQAIGGGIVDAYTAKRALPRILAAAVLINLSYYIVALTIDLSNIVGLGIMNLITAPFGLNQGFDLSTLNGSAQTTAGLGLGGAAAGAGVVAASFVAGAGGVGAALGAALSILWSVVLLPVLLIFLFVMLTLIVRLGLIYVLILLSPVAFALYAMPNTEKYFRNWWETLFKTLLIFPIIAVLFAISKVMAQATIWATGSSGIKGGFAYILSLVILVAPLIGIPFAFRLAGGILGRAHDIMTGARAKINGSGYMKQRRQGAMQRGGMNIQQGRNRAITSFGNTRVGKGISRAPILGGRMKKAVQGSSQSSLMLAANAAKDPRAQATQDDDNKLRAQFYDNAAEARTGVRTHYRQSLQKKVDEGTMTADQADADAAAEADRAVAAVQASDGFGRAQAINALQRAVDTGTAFRSGDVEDLSQQIARASGGNSSTIAGLAGYANAKTKQVGRHDLATSFGTLNNLASGEASELYGKDLGGDKSAKEYAKGRSNAWNSASLYQHVNDKPQNIESHIAHYAQAIDGTLDRQLTADVAAGHVTRVDADRQATEAKEDSAIFFHELKTAQPNASGEVRVRIDKALSDHGDQVEQAISTFTPSAPSASTGRTVYDPSAPPQQNPTTGEYERVPVAVRGETARERIERRSRAYERYDPNRG